MTDQERNDLLIRVDARTEQLMKWTERHVELHARLSLAFVGAAVSALLALGTTIASLILALSRNNGG